MLNSLSSDSMRRVGMLLWAIWWRRKGKVWEDVDHPTAVVIRRASEELSEGERVQSKSPSSVSVHQHQVRWHKPPLGSVKCNYAAIFKEHHCCGVGICIRDHSGHFILAKNSLVDGVLLPTEAEARACLEAISWVQDQNNPR